MLRLLRAAILFLKFRPEIGAFPEWKPGDAKNWSGYCGTEAGAKMERIMALYCTQMALDACMNDEKGDFHRGIAFGARQLAAYLESHKFRTPQTEEGTPEDQSGIPDEFK